MGVPSGARALSLACAGRQLRSRWKPPLSLCEGTEGDWFQSGIGCALCTGKVGNSFIFYASHVSITYRIIKGDWLVS